MDHVLNSVVTSLHPLFPSILSCSHLPRSSLLLSQQIKAIKHSLQGLRSGVFIRAHTGRHLKGQASTIALRMFLCWPSKAPLNSSGKSSLGRFFRAAIAKASSCSRLLVASSWRVDGQLILTFLCTGAIEIPREQILSGKTLSACPFAPSLLFCHSQALFP